MSKEDSHSISFNLHGSIGSTTQIPIPFPQDYRILALDFEDYVFGIENHGSSIWHAITKEPLKYLKTKEVVTTQERLDDIVVDGIESDEKKKV